MEAQHTRRLAAILAADVVGYSRQMGADEEGTLTRLNVLRREFACKILTKKIESTLLTSIFLKRARK